VFQSGTGQVDEQSPFIVRSVNFAARFTPSTITAAVVRYPADSESEHPTPNSGNAIVLTFKGASPVTLVGQDALKGSVNSVVGRDHGRWLKKIPSFNALQYRNLYPGVQALVRADTGRLAYSFLLEPRANPASIRIAVDGIRSLTLDQRENLVMETSGGRIVQTRPRFFEIKGGEKIQLRGRFAVLGDNEYGFVVEGHDPRARLLIDPEIVFATYFGGTGDEGYLGADEGGMDFIGRGFDTAIGPNGHMYVIGLTASADFPVNTGGPMNGSSDVFVMRIDPTQPAGQQIVYATFIGGSSGERGRSVAPLADGGVYITGHTSSPDFPTSAGVVQQTYERSGAYVARLNGDGSFDIGTMIGRALSHHPNSVVFSKRPSEAEGFVYAAGSAWNVTVGGNASDATSGSYQASPAGGEYDGFLVKLDSELTRYEYFTYFGGANRDVIMDLDVNDGFAFVTGTTTSTDFPTTELAMQAQHSQAPNANVNCASDNPPRRCFDAFVARFNRGGSGLVYSTLYGSDREEYARGIAVTSRNQATITGAARATAGWEADIFVTRFEAGGENFFWDRRLTAQKSDHGEEVVVDQFGRTHFTGTISLDGRATGIPSETFHGGGSDIFYGRISEFGEVEFFTYLGGAGEDRGFAIAAAGPARDRFCAMVAGSTTSDDIQTVRALSGGETRRGGADLLLYALCDIEYVIDEEDFEKRALQSTVNAGGEVTFTLTVTNRGDVDAPVEIVDDVPIRVTGVEAPCEHDANNRVTCSFKARAGESKSINIRARAGQQCPTTIVNTATLQVYGERFTKTVSVAVRCVPDPVTCPNGRPDPGEQCDDDNFVTGDGCRPDCTREVCTDGILDSPKEECDDGNQNNNDRCTNQCRKQLIEGDVCTANSPPCTAGLVCGRGCGLVEDCRLVFLPPFILCDSYWLCDVDATCMPADKATPRIDQ
jgi:cysteine-rich repeat protein